MTPTHSPLVAQAPAENRIITNEVTSHTMDYWQALYDAGRLSYRLCETAANPNMDDVLAHLRDPQTLNFTVAASATDPTVIGEFALDQFTGSAARVHFSMPPRQDALFSIRLATEVADYILDRWRGDNRDPYITTIYGMTPTPNRAACRFISHCGFKKIGILSDGMVYRGNVVDVLLTQRRRTNDG